MKKVMLLAGAAALAFSVTAAAAQGTKSKKTPAAAPRTAISMECSKQADAKGLHGKARKAFRAKCKRNGAKGA